MSETTQVTEAGAAPEAVDAVLGQLMGDFAATAGVILTGLGLRLGLWDALAAGPATAETVAERAGAAVPYVREWLRSQAAAGYVGYDPAAGTFALAPFLGDPRLGMTQRALPPERRGRGDRLTTLA
jgi:Rv2258c-like winged HTH domain